MYRLTLEQVEEIKPYLFAGLDKNFANDVKSGDVIVVGENFGCGQLVKMCIRDSVAGQTDRGCTVKRKWGFGCGGVLCRVRGRAEPVV